MKTILNVKTDKKLKRRAQEVARELGLPLGAIVNSYLRDLVREKRVIFSIPPAPNQMTQKLLRKIEKDISKNRNVSGPLTYEDAVEYLDNL